MIKKAIFPSSYIQGSNILNRLDQIDDFLNKKIFFICSNSGYKNAILPNLSKWDKNIISKCELFKGKSTWEEINRVLSIAKDFKPDFIAGVGGGKCIDTARVAAFKLGVPFLSIPTIAATDAPTASACVIHDDNGVMVDYFNTKNPAFVIVDSQIISRAPSRFLISGMGDALSTWFEAETCYSHNIKNVAGEYNTRAAMAIAKECRDTILEFGYAAKVANDNRIVTPALEHIIEANILLSGVGFESCGISSAHGIQCIFHHTKAGEEKYHGELVAFSLLASFFLENKPIHMIDEIYNFNLKVGLPITLNDLGLENISYTELEEATLHEMSNASTLLNRIPFKVSVKELVDSIIMADSYGKLLNNC